MNKEIQRIVEGSPFGDPHNLKHLLRDELFSRIIEGDRYEFEQYYFWQIDEFCYKAKEKSEELIIELENAAEEEAMRIAEERDRIIDNIPDQLDLKKMTKSQLIVYIEDLKEQIESIE